MRTGLIAALLAVLAPTVLSWAGPALAAAPADPLLGAWRLVPAKSRGTPAPLRSQVIIFYMEGDKLADVADSVDAKGGRRQGTNAGPLDGVAYPQPDGRIMAMRRLGPSSIERAFPTSDGRPPLVVTVVVSPDGETMTATVRGAGPQGPFEAVNVYER